MTPQELLRLERIEGLLAQLVKSDRYTIQRSIQMFDGRNIQLGLTTGTKIGTSTSQKIGLWNTTPVDQPAAISGVTVTGAAEDSVARTAINSILAALREIGIIAT